MAPRSATASTEIAFGRPLLISVVPSIGSTAKSHSGPSPLPTSSPLYSIGAWSFSPSPITTTPRIDTVLTSSRMASTAAPSPPSLSPRPTQRPAAMAPASVTRTSSIARLRSGASPRARAGDEPDADDKSGGSLMVADCPRSGSVCGNWDTRAMSDEPQPNAEVGEPAPGRGPVARPAKPRLLQDGRDMFWSLIPLVIGCIVLAGLVGMCSFQPVGTNKGVIPAYDAAAALRADAQTLGFPIRLPRLPAGWHPNSGDRGGIENGRTDPSTGQRLHAAT